MISILTVTIITFPDQAAQHPQMRNDLVACQDFGPFVGTSNLRGRGPTKAS